MGEAPRYAAGAAASQENWWLAQPSDPCRVEIGPQGFVVNVWRLGRRHYGYRVYEGNRPVANFREAEDAALAVRLHNDHVRAQVDAQDRKTERGSD